MSILIPKTRKVVQTKGHVDLCLNEDGSLIAICGLDGEAKIFTNFDDQEPETLLIGEAAYAIIIRNEKLYVATDVNTIQSYNIKDSSTEDVLLKFSSNVTHFQFNSRGNLLVAGSSDFKIKTLNVDNKVQKIFSGHGAPILTVSFSFDDNYVFSSSCDGTLRMWDIKLTRQIHSINCFLKSNDSTTSKTLARFSLNKDGKVLYIPVEGKILVSAAEDLKKCSEFSSVEISNHVISVTSLSSCGLHLAASSNRGQISIWNTDSHDLLFVQEFYDKGSITCLKWQVDTNDILMCTDAGYMCCFFPDFLSISRKKFLGGVINIEDCLSNHQNSQNTIQSNENENFEDLFDDEFDEADMLTTDNGITNEKLEKYLSTNKNRVNELSSKKIEQNKLSTNKKDLKKLPGNETERKKLTANENEDGLANENEDETSVGESDAASEGGIPGIDTDEIDNYDDDDFNNDVNGNASGKNKMSVMQEDDENSNVSDWSKQLTDLPNSIKTNILPTIVKGWEPTPLQKPFQPSSSPLCLSSRFMLWNDVGRVIQYNQEDEQSINVEFHDSSTHHALHIDNSRNYTLAGLSDRSLVLACEADSANPSQLHCTHFNSLDTGNSKEWTLGLPDGEDIQILNIGENWIATATDHRIVRIFSEGGMQLLLFSTVGPVVTMASKRNLLVVVYHAGMGISEDQCLSYQLFCLASKRLLHSDRLPLSVKSTLTWIGFSNEGSLCTVDSLGIVRMLNKSFANTWIPVANLKQLCKGKLDNYWVVSVNENPQQIRAILCKGSKYPATLPLPTVHILFFQLPLCEMTSEKSVLEENFLRTTLFFDSCSESEFGNLNEMDEQRIQTTIQEQLLKLFALACHGKRELRALEVCRLMPNSRMVQLAIKYASQRGHMRLAENLTGLAREKNAEENKLLLSQDETVEQETELAKQENGSMNYRNNSCNNTNGSFQYSDDSRSRDGFNAKIRIEKKNSRTEYMREDSNQERGQLKNDLELNDVDDLNESCDDQNSNLRHTKKTFIDEDSQSSISDDSMFKAKKNEKTTFFSKVPKFPTISTSQTSKLLKNPFKVLGNAPITNNKNNNNQQPQKNIFDSSDWIKPAPVNLSGKLTKKNSLPVLSNNKSNSVVCVKEKNSKMQMLIINGDSLKEEANRKRKRENFFFSNKTRDCDENSRDNNNDCQDDIENNEDDTLTFHLKTKSKTN